MSLPLYSIAGARARHNAAMDSPFVLHTARVTAPGVPPPRRWLAVIHGLLGMKLLL